MQYPVWRLVSGEDWGRVASRSNGPCCLASEPRLPRRTEAFLAGWLLALRPLPGGASGYFSAYVCICWNWFNGQADNQSLTR